MHYLAYGLKPVLRYRRNMFLNQLSRPSTYISFCVLLWGIISIGTGQWASVVLTYHLSTFCRCLPEVSWQKLFFLLIRLGWVVSAWPLYCGSYLASRRRRSIPVPYSYFPHGMYYLPSRGVTSQLKCSRYKCDELGLRVAYIFCGASISASLGYIVESSILTIMDGKLGYAAWR